MRRRPFRLHPARLALGLAVLAPMVVAAGCERRERASADRPVPAAAGDASGAAPTAAAAPLTYESKTAFADLSLSLPQAVVRVPDLHAQLYQASVRDLQVFAEGAQADRTEAGGDGGLPAYSRTIEFTPGAETERLFSLGRVSSDYTGGAHPNPAFSAVLWDKTARRRIAASDLFASGAGAAGLDRALCDAVNREKRARTPGAELVPMTEGGAWRCPAAAETPFVLAAGTVAGRAGGVTFLIGPYQVDSYAAGLYEITVPQATVRPWLAPAWADQFAGQPRG